MALLPKYFNKMDNYFLLISEQYWQNINNPNDGTIFHDNIVNIGQDVILINCFVTRESTVNLNSHNLYIHKFLRYPIALMA